MATVAPPANPERDPRVKAVFDDIRATRKTDYHQQPVARAGLRRPACWRAPGPMSRP
jgi:hypothetical protein